MSYNDPSGVALVKELCPICTIAIDGPIVISTIRSEKKMKQVDELHGKVVGMAPKPCKECQEMMNQGFVLILCDEQKTTDMNDPWRTGQIMCVKLEAAKRWFDKQPDSFFEKGACFINWRTAEMIGLPVNQPAS